MKMRVVLICMVSLLLVMPGAVAADVLRTDFTSWVTAVDVLEPGEPSYPDGRGHFRDRVEGLIIDSEDDYLVGYRVAHINGNLDANGLGPVWGTYHMEVDAYDGYWEGSFTGKFTEAGPVIRMQGQGYGELEGMRIEGTFAAMEGGVLGTEGTLIVLPSH
jgi:hypothetical protein